MVPAPRAPEPFSSDTPYRRPPAMSRSIFSRPGQIALLVTPGIAVILFAIVAPITLSGYFSLTDWTGFGKIKFVGLSNFRAILSADPAFWRSLLNALLLAVVTLAIQNPIAFFVAALLRKLPARRSRPFRTIFFVPAVLSLVVITKLWVNIFNPTYGLLNKVLMAVGLKSLTTSWLTNVNTAIWAVIFIVVWQGFGWALLFYYSGLMTVPREMEEAAMIDGASGLTLYGRIIIPYLLPVIQAVAVIGIISCLKQMEIVYLSTNGAPGNTTQFIANYIYIKAFTYSEFGYGNALSVLFIIIAVALTVITQRSTRRLPEAE
jgi:raffinose/stachyose/melibiose transport system permease protein